jgi:hypothetical protein
MQKLTSTSVKKSKPCDKAFILDTAVSPVLISGMPVMDNA